MVSLEPAAATARSRHWCSFEPDGKHGSGVTYRSVMTPFRRRSRSGVCSHRTLGPQVPAEGAYMAQSKKRKDKGAGGVRMLPVLHPDAAGIDIGAEEVFVAVSPDRAVEPVR
jgi:hypothetical protein